ncbi:uncharacterized protein LOC119576343 [Penaeus monodon]|uniref:uncharacterized protein LOC119576343 n=1 Tax=Penaeus monodon TaxID=6687 RepID=UPI0018A7B7B0|nr:uncharacterized protein LOC119576343 [Penaeus monodon]XP_037779915.1 uncharacterized protein LOC119576343 [Penaeus monodon]
MFSRSPHNSTYPLVSRTRTRWPMTSRDSHRTEWHRRLFFLERDDSRSGGMAPACQMTARTACRPRTIGSPPAFSSSAGMPFSLQIASLIPVRFGGSPLTDGSGTGIVTPHASKLTTGSVWQNCSKYSVHEPKHHKMIRPSAERAAVACTTFLGF